MNESAAVLRSIVDALQSGRPAAAEQLAREMLLRTPGHESALTLLGMSLHAQAAVAQAADIYRELTVRYPGSRGHWSNLATMLRECGRLDDAESAYRHALHLAPPDATLCFNLGLLLTQKGELADSRDFLLEAHRLDPASSEIRIHAALACYECGDNTVAQRLLDGWQDWRGVAAESELDLGWILGLLGHVDAAETLLRRAATRESDQLHARARLAMLFERSNRLGEARALLAGMPAAAQIRESGLRNDVVSAHAALLAREGDAAMLPSGIGELLDAQPAAAVRANLLFLQARAYDRLHDADGAMSALHEAHALQFEAMAKLEPMLAAGGVEPLMRAAKNLDAERFQAWPEHVAPLAQTSPIFIVGFPRSGTTMLEQMLDAHPALGSMDERAFLQDLIDRMESRGLRYPDDLGRLDEAQCEALRALYWRLVADTGRLQPGRRLVDKNPLNLLRLPIIMRLFPQAPIVLALRHPCDVLLSCYMQNFRSPAFALICASLDSLARGYVNAMRFWIRHAQLMQPRMLVLRYEDLLDDFPGHVDRLAAFLGLDDASPMLHFHEHASRKSFISTPSYTQVVRPPSKSAIGRWHAYERWFEPVLPTLRPIIGHWGYAE